MGLQNITLLYSNIHHCLLRCLIPIGIFYFSSNLPSLSGNRIFSLSLVFWNFTMLCLVINLYYLLFIYFFWLVLREAFKLKYFSIVLTHLLWVILYFLSFLYETSINTGIDNRTSGSIFETFNFFFYFYTPLYFA